MRPERSSPSWPSDPFRGGNAPAAGHAGPDPGGAVDPPDSARRGWLEWAVLAHVAGLVVFTTWDFGGETDLARGVIEWWGSLAVVLTIAACLRRRSRHRHPPATLRWLWPLMVFDGLVLAGALNPSFTRAVVGGADALVLGTARWWWPSCARPAIALHQLWQFNAIYLAGFNLALVVSHRRALRTLLFVLTVNALLLAVMGTFQQFAHSPGIYFGRQASPNLTFFATFVYHNHWGAYVVLSAAAALGLMFHCTRPGSLPERRHSPAFFGLVATLFMAAAVPLSGSRAGSLLVLVLAGGAFLAWLFRLRRSGRSSGRSQATAIVAAVVIFLASLGGIFLLGRSVIETRLDKTREQIGEIRRLGGLGSREQLYSDTWRMARQKLWFGWGLGSYATVFQLFNGQVSVEGWVPFYAQAHSDWLQLLAETGLAGTVLVLLMALLPLASLRRMEPLGALPAFLLAGCGLIALYALVEFPLANPAVLEVFWVLFFTALRYHKLTAGAA